MPWAIIMLQDCLDPFTGQINKWPWPLKDWSYNNYALRTMNYVQIVYQLLTKDEEWTPADNKLYVSMHQ